MRKTKENVGKNSGITLVALVITIIVLLILAGVTLTMVVGDSGIFAKAQEAKKQTNIANTKEQIQMEITDIQANNQGNITEEQLKMILEKYGTINYKEDGKTIKSIITKEDKHEIAIEEIYKGKTTQENKKLATQVITAQNYGEEVNYSANGVDSWKVFLNDGKNVYIIASDYVLSSGVKLEDDIKAGDGQYCITGDNQSSFVNFLESESNWSKYAEGFDGAKATGGPTLEQFWLSFNKKYNTNYANDVNLLTHTGYSDKLYFQHEEPWNNCYGYWLSSAYVSDVSSVWRIHWKGTVEMASCNVTYYRNSSISMFSI